MQTYFVNMQHAMPSDIVNHLSNVTHFKYLITLWAAIKPQSMPTLLPRAPHIWGCPVHERSHAHMTAQECRIPTEHEQHLGG